MSKRKSLIYAHAVKALRRGFIDEAKSKTLQVGKGLTKTEAKRRAREKQPIGRDYEYDTKTGKFTINRRVGRLADGFDSADGFDLREVDQWTPAQKAKVTRVFKTAEKLSRRPYHLYRSTKKENLRRVQEAAQHAYFPKELKVAFVPVSQTEEPPKIKIKKKKVTIKEGQIAKDTINFKDFGIGPKELDEDPIGHVEELVKQVPAKAYIIQCGEYEMTGPSFDAEGLPEAVAKFVNKYAAGAYVKGRSTDPDDPNSSYYGNWLNGVIAFDFPRVKSFQAYRRAKAKEKSKQAIRRRRAREKFRKKYGKKRARST